MKKIFNFALVALMATAFVACGNNNDPKEPQEEGVTFNITVSDITATAATVTVVPSDTTVSYYFDLWPAEEYAALANDAELAEYYVSDFQEAIDYYASQGYDLTVEDFLSQGEDSYDFSGLNPETEYVAFAFVFDGTQIVGKVETKSFSTEAVVASDMTLTFQANDTALFIIPSSNESYFASYEYTDTLAAYGYAASAYAQALYDYLVSGYGSYFSYYCEYDGAIYMPLSELEGASEWFACGSTGGVQTTDWFFHTQPAPAASGAPMHVYGIKSGKKLCKGSMMLKEAKKVEKPARM